MQYLTGVVWRTKIRKRWTIGIRFSSEYFHCCGRLDGAALPSWTFLSTFKTVADYISFRKRYNIVGRVTDMPAAVAPFVASHAPTTNL
jgi:hypothetical protein